MPFLSPGGEGSAALGTLPGGYAQVTANQTGMGNAVADLTGLSVTVTVELGRRIRITGSIEGQSTAATVLILFVNEGASTLNTRNVPLPTASQDEGVVCQVVLTPTAGSHTYKLQGWWVAGTPQLSAAANHPSFILVEDIGT